MNSVKMFGKEITEVNSVELASGATSVRLMTLKEYKAKHGLTGNAARRAHRDYILSTGKEAGGAFSSGLARGEICIIGTTTAKDGNSGTVRWVGPAHKKLQAPEARAKAIDLASPAAKAAMKAELSKLLAGAGLDAAAVAAELAKAGY